MLLFDIGAVLFLASLIWIIMFSIKRNWGVVVFSVILSLIAGILMIISYYLLMGNQSIFDKMIS